MLPAGHCVHPLVSATPNWVGGGGSGHTTEIVLHALSSHANVHSSRLPLTTLKGVQAAEGFPGRHSVSVHRSGGIGDCTLTTLQSLLSLQLLMQSFSDATIEDPTEKQSPAGRVPFQ